MRGEADIEAEWSEPQAGAPAELHPFALVALHPAPQGEGADTLLDADLHEAGE